MSQPENRKFAIAATVWRLSTIQVLRETRCADTEVRGIGRTGGAERRRARLPGTAGPEVTEERGL